MTRWIAIAGAALVSALPLASRADTTAATPDTKAQVDLKAGRIIFEDNCIFCHGEQGKGNGVGSWALRPKPANFTDLEHMAKIPAPALRKAVLMGGKSVGASRAMPAWKDALSEEQVDDVLAYILSIGK